MRRVVFICASLTSFVSTAPAWATVGVDIDLTHQRMHVQSSSGTYDWPISSARSGFYTPGGSYAPTRLEVMHYSHKYHMSPMPHAIFFRGGYAIHGTYAIGSLGRPASHGCVRLSPGNAALLYGMVKAEGARISISGSPPQGSTRVAHVPRQIARADAGDGLEPTVGSDPAPMAPRARRRVMRQASSAADYSAYGYRYVGRMNGHNVYQPVPAQTGLFQLFGGDVN